MQCQHIHLICGNLDTMIDFWVKGFGAKLEQRRDFSGVPGAVMDLNISAKLYLKSADCERADAVKPAAGIEHLGFLVDDLEQAMRDLQALSGVSVERGPYVAGSRRCCFIKGPEGILVEIMQEIAAPNG